MVGGGRRRLKAHADAPPLYAAGGHRRRDDVDAGVLLMRHQPTWALDRTELALNALPLRNLSGNGDEVALGNPEVVLAGTRRPYAPWRRLVQ